MTTSTTLEERFTALGGNAAHVLRRNPLGLYEFPLKTEYTNWRDEQRAWRNTAVLFDQSHHMFEVAFRGPDVKRLFNEVTVNNFSSFAKNKAKHLVACNYEGYFIGDGIVFGYNDDEATIVGPPPASNWVQFHAETGDYKVDVTRDDATPFNPSGRLKFRYQLQGPFALKIAEKASNGTLPPIKYFHIGEFEIAGRPVRALNHTMTAVPGQEHTGLEIFGPVADGPAVLDALLTAGEEFGIQQGGALAYPTTPLESGWIALPAPAIYSGDRMQAYREHLSADSLESLGSIGGSFVSDNIDDYYLNPFELGYGRTIKFDHDFIARDALEAMASQPHRTKVWLVLDNGDMARVYADSLFGAGDAPKYMTLPIPVYSTFPYDQVLIDGRPVGVSTSLGYTANLGAMCTLALIDEADAIDGAEVSLVWGEPDGGTSKPFVERHVQTNIRATIRTSVPPRR